MNIDLMRKIDFYIGVPLCFIVNIVNKIILAMFPMRHSGAVTKILFIELSEMGSAILADPCMRQARSQGAEIYFLIFKKNRMSLFLLNTVKPENIFVLREHSIGLLLWDSLRFVFWCRRNRIEATVDLELFSRVTSLLTWASFAPIKVGFHRFHHEGLYRGEMLTHKVPYNPQIHIAHNFMNLIESIFTRMSPDGFLKRPLLQSDREVAKAVIPLLSKANVQKKMELATKVALKEQPSGKLNVLLVNANAGEFLPQRKWPADNFASLIQMFLNEFPNYFVLMTGSPEESDGNEIIRKKVNHLRCINFAGGVDFIELPVLYSLCPFLITNDSGPGHFSSVTDIRSYVFFGPETPDLYGSLGNSFPFYSRMSCSPCVSATNHRKTDCTDNKCLQVITPATVFAKLKSEMATQSSPQ